MNTPLWVVPWLPQQIQDGGGRHLSFRENVNNSGLDKDICTKFYGKSKPDSRDIIK